MQEGYLHPKTLNLNEVAWILHRITKIEVLDLKNALEVASKPHLRKFPDDVIVLDQDDPEEEEKKVEGEEESEEVDPELGHDFFEQTFIEYFCPICLLFCCQTHRKEGEGNVFIMEEQRKLPLLIDYSFYPRVDKDKLQKNMAFQAI